MIRKELKRDFILLNVGYAYHNADWNWKNIHSPFARIHYVKSGTAKIIREDGFSELKKDHLYLTPSYTKHAYECDGMLELYYIHLYEDLGKNISLFDQIDFPAEIEADPLDIQLIERLIRINPERELQYYDPNSYDNSAHVAYNMALQQKTPLAFEMESHGIIQQIISRFLARAVFKNEHMEERIVRSLHYIHKNIDKPIEIEQLAEICFLTKDHFIRLFKKEMHCTPGKYINQKKIETAQLRLLLNQEHIKDIAYGLGFDNISYFNRLFYKMTGESPGRYKKQRML
ncbi:AraC-like DNA-binding protein [Parabacteroides sp. PFB2-10]|uniref:helix-turn-helix domain-containing protein n=1 Tax=Parabacteroides sp. PFB2-10 TaxID=1742405 RepID=UPI0024730505|nr:AraC family transcriptional regulator [Parabacteroides sp. PFB2-10]MDH6313612.1 AraC-like DNA-binding protein [Parabacteroides sp. PFB2-10]MDL2244482.1 AraC family transcriptional regulator [Parabacteroides sp. OttesenSCG-928-J18]